MALTYPDRERGLSHGDGDGDRRSAAASRRRGARGWCSMRRARGRRRSGAAERWRGGETLELTLPPSMAALEVGDAIEAADGTRFEITEIRDGLARKIAARAIVESASGGGAVGSAAGRRRRCRRRCRCRWSRSVHLPPRSGDAAQSRLVLAAWASPWPGEVSVVDEATGARSCAADAGGVDGRAGRSAGARARPVLGSRGRC